jgi:hypothetical protein
MRLKVLCEAQAYRMSCDIHHHQVHAHRNQARVSDQILLKFGSITNSQAHKMVALVQQEAARAVPKFSQ